MKLALLRSNFIDICFHRLSTRAFLPRCIFILVSDSLDDQHPYRVTRVASLQQQDSLNRRHEPVS